MPDARLLLRANHLPSLIASQKGKIMLKKSLPISLLLLSLLQLSAQAPSFTFQLFDVPNSASTEADNINARGNIVGFFFDQAGHQHGFFHSQGAFTQLDFPGATATKTVGLNNRDDIVGVLTDASGNQHGLLRDGITAAFTQINFPNAVATPALSINDAREIAGSFTDTAGPTHRFMR